MAIYPRRWVISLMVTRSIRTSARYLAASGQEDNQATPSAPRLSHLHAEDDGDSEQYRIVYHFPNGENLVLLNCPHVLRHTKIVLALQELTERERLVAILDLYEGLGLREIAFVLEMLPSAVIELQADAIQHLNTALSRT
jgi:DNA-directed RNA polymerase specialized sigma24 family protein